MGIQGNYFLLAVVFFGSAGIWMPIGLEQLIYDRVTYSSVPTNVLTYFASLLFAGSIDYYIKEYRKFRREGTLMSFFRFIWLFLACIVLIFFSAKSSVKGNVDASLLWGIIGTLVAYRVWWIANTENENFRDSSNASELGGATNRSLNNN